MIYAQYFEYSIFFSFPLYFNIWNCRELFWTKTNEPLFCWYSDIPKQIGLPIADFQQKSIVCALCRHWNGFVMCENLELCASNSNKNHVIALSAGMKQSIGDWGLWLRFSIHFRNEIMFLYNVRIHTQNYEKCPLSFWEYFRFEENIKTKRMFLLHSQINTYIVGQCAYC